MMIGSLCTGFGGLEMAVRAVLGGEVAWAADNAKAVRRLIEVRMPGIPNLGDIGTVTWEDVPCTDILCAGFPCQDVSQAGARRGLRPGTRTGLWAAIARAIGILRPPLVILENVRGLLHEGAHSDVEPCPWCLGDAGGEHHLRALGAVLGDLSALGYVGRYRLVPASAVGAPHRRDRIFITAWPSHANPPHRARHVRQYGNGGGAPGGRCESAGNTGGGGGVAADAELPRRAGGARRGMQGAGRPEREPAGVGEPVAYGGGPRLGFLPGGVPSAQEPSYGDLAGDLGRERPDLWGRYAPAIARWEGILGRAAPRPVEPAPKGGWRLSPLFTEWMMGLPEGHVTGAGLSRQAQMEILGNGVVPQQAELALRLLLVAE